MNLPGAFFLAAWAALPGPPGPGELEIVVIDVGYGDALLVRSAEAGAWLIDTGYPEKYEKVEAALRDRGVDRLDSLLITHPHPDHMGGAARAAAEFRPGRVFDNGLPPPAGFSPEAWREYLEVFRGHPGYSVIRPGPLPGWRGETAAVVGVGGVGEVNADSAVLRLEHAGRTVLLTGDLNRKGEEKLLAEGAALDADLLKVGHHGGGDVASARFLAAAAPRWAAVSVGPNPWGAPAPETIRRLEEAGVRVLRTDRDGTLTFRIKPDGEVWLYTREFSPLILGRRFRLRPD